MIADDTELLRRYAAHRDEAAFAALVERYLKLVYFAALRQVGGDAHRAEDVTQTVFTLLARKAPALTQHQTLAGWLHTTTRFAASQAMRAERRRLAREQEAHTMHETTSDPTANVEWDRLRPAIDEALNELSEADREAVLLRFFADQPLAEVGRALNVSENAARMRVDRALDKLHALLARRGMTSTAAALGLALANQAAAAVPAGLAASVTSGALAGAATAGGSAVALKILSFMSTTKILAGVASLAVLAATAITLRQQQTNTDLRAQVSALHQDAATLTALREENHRLLAAQTAAQDTAVAEHNELVQLRAEKAAFLKAIADRKAAAARAGEAAAGGRTATGNGTLAPGMVSVDLMANVGRATPTGAAQTIAWALQRADYKAVAGVLAFEPAEREKLEAFIATLPESLRAQYGTPEQIVALVMAGTPKPLAGVQLLSRTQPDPDTELHVVQWQYQSGDVQQDTLKFHREADGWKQVVSPTMVNRVIGYLKAKQ